MLASTLVEGAAPPDVVTEVNTRPSLLAKASALIARAANGGPEYTIWKAGSSAPLGDDPAASKASISRCLRCKLSARASVGALCCLAARREMPRCLQHDKTSPEPAGASTRGRIWAASAPAGTVCGLAALCLRAGAYEACSPDLSVPSVPCLHPPLEYVNRASYAPLLASLRSTMSERNRWRMWKLMHSPCARARFTGPTA